MGQLTRIAREYFSERTDDFVFHRYRSDLSFRLKQGSGLYLHIPFCTHFCPYCPYNKIRYDRETAKQYKEAVIRELMIYHRLYGTVAFSSLYVGGGTPTLLMPEIEEIMENLTRYFILDGKSCIESHPNDIDTAMAGRIKSAGFSMVSLGVQSFRDDLLKMIGRDYNGKQAIRAIECLKSAGFDTLNADLIFAIENQTMQELESDLRTAIDLGLDQITCYPLFTFPYSEIGELRRLKRVKVPGRAVRKEMYYFIHDFMLQQAFTRTSVWSFNRQEKERYSSVTRDYYLGLGAGAGSYNGRCYYFNTFSVPAYISQLGKDLPVSLKMDVSPRMERSFWLYWRLYETELDKRKYSQFFYRDIETDYRALLALFRLGGLIERENGSLIRLTRRGSHYIHQVQNAFALDYVNSIWKASKTVPWPEDIRI